MKRHTTENYYQRVNREREREREEGRERGGRDRGRERERGGGEERRERERWGRGGEWGADWSKMWESGEERRITCYSALHFVFTPPSTLHSVTQLSQTHNTSFGPDTVKAGPRVIGRKPSCNFSGEKIHSSLQFAPELVKLAICFLGFVTSRHCHLRTNCSGKQRSTS